MIIRRTAIFLLLLGLAVAGSADWLVTRDGERIETDGPWEVKGATVIFSAPNGSLRSLRLSDVDLEASSEVTEEAKRSHQAPTEEPAPTEQPALMLTNKDIRRGVSTRPVETGPGDSAEDVDREESAESAAAALEPGPVQVVAIQHRYNYEINGLEITGTVLNSSSDIVTGIVVKVSLRDAGGETLAVSDAFLGMTSLAARSSTTFRALFPGIDELGGQPDFEVRSRALLFTISEESEQETGEDRPRPSQSPT